MPTNFDTVRKRVHDLLYGGDAVLLRGTVDSGTTATIVDAAIGRSTAITVDHMDGAFAKIVTDAAAGTAPQGEVREVQEAGFTAASGTVTVSPVFSVSPAVSDTYEIWPRWQGSTMHPDAIDRLLNRKLRELHMPSLFPLSLDLVASDNNDFEQTITTNAITGWTLDGSATATNETTIVYNGTRSAKTVHTTIATDFYHRVFFAHGGKTYYTAIMAAADASEAGTLVVVDGVTSTVIADATTSTSSPAFSELIVPWTMPSGTGGTAHIRLTGVATGATVYWDDYQTWADGGGVYKLPSWITRKEQIISIIAFPPGRGGSANDYDYIADERNSQKLAYRFERADTRATNELYVYVQNCSNWRPYIVAYRPLDEVAADYVTTVANTIPLSSTEADALVLGVMAELHRQKANDSVGEIRAQHTREAQRYEREWDGGTRHLRPEWRENTIQHNRAYGVVA